MYIKLGYSIILIPVIKQKEEHVLIIIRGKYLFITDKITSDKWNWLIDKFISYALY